MITEALAEQARKLITPSPAFYNEPSMRARRSASSSTVVFERVFFTNSGAEANEGAIKLARKWGALNTRRRLRDHHLRRTPSTAARWPPCRRRASRQFETLFEPKVPGFPKAKLNDLASVERLITDKTVAVMLEPIQGEAGVIIGDGRVHARPARTDAAARPAADRRRDPDRHGPHRASCCGYEHAGIEPDIMTLGKGLGGGVPLAALVAKEAVCCFEPGDQGGTFNGNPLMAAVGLRGHGRGARARVSSQAWTRAGDYLMKGLSQACRPGIGLGEVRGRGLLLALDLGRDDRTRLVELGASTTGCCSMRRARTCCASCRR